MTARRIPAISPNVLGGAYYLTYFAAGGSTYPYYNLFYQAMGMTNQQIGLLAAIPTVMTMFAAPLWAALADRMNIHHILLPGLLFGTLLPAALLAGATTNFWALALLVLAFSLFMSPTIPLAENAIVTMLGNRRDRYGALRLWGAVGFGLSSWAVGFLTGARGMASIWVAYMVLVLPALFIATRLPIPRMTAPTAYLSNLRQLLRNRRWLTFLAAIFMVGMGYAMYDNFYAIHLKSLGAAPGLIGLIFMVATISELPVFFFSSVLIRRLTLRGVMVMAFLAFAVRGLAWSFVTTPEWGLVVQLLHGLSFSAMWTAGVLYVSQIAPEGLGASAQSLFVMMFSGLSKAIGAMIGAQLYDTLGAAPMFQAGALVALVGALLFVLAERRADRREAAHAVGQP